MITLGKKPTLANRRLAFDRLRDRDVVTKLFNELGPRYAGAPGRLPAHPEVRLPPGRQRADGAGRADRPAGTPAGGRRRRRKAAVTRSLSRGSHRARTKPGCAARLFLCARRSRRVASSLCCGSIARWRIPSSSPAARATSARTSSSSSRGPATRRSCSTTSPTARRAVLPRLQALAGAPVPCVEADVRDVDALRARVPRPPDRRASSTARG